jgi:hypothetical protein
MLPTIELGRNYDFTTLTSSPPGDSDTQKMDTASDFSLFTFLEAQISPDEQGITVWNPQDNEAVATYFPNFIGTAPANTNLDIVVESDDLIEGSTVSDDRGNWQWSSPQALSTGETVITVSYTNTQGVYYELARVFTVLAEDEQDPSTIEATPSPTSTPIQTTVSPEVSLTPILPSPTPTASATPTPTDTPTPFPTIVTEPTIPAAGVSYPTLGLAAAGLLIIGLGLALVL